MVVVLEATYAAISGLAHCDLAELIVFKAFDAGVGVGSACYSAVGVVGVGCCVGYLVCGLVCGGCAGYGSAD